MSARVEVLIDGKWTEVGGLSDVRPEWEPLEEVEGFIDPEPMTWTMEGTIAGEPMEFWDAIAQAEREAFARACAARLWLMFPLLTSKGPATCTPR